MTGLQSWIGWTKLQERVEHAGFHVPKQHQTWMETFCSSTCGRSDLRQYWAEVATESVLNEAAANPNVRMEPSYYPHYRSEYLDRLSSEIFPAGAGSIIHPCIMAFHENNIASDFELLFGIRSDFERAKTQEAEGFGLVPPAPGDMRLKKQLVPIVEHAARGCGFARVKGSPWPWRYPGLLFSRTDALGRTFLIGLDTGGNREIVGSLPLKFLAVLESQGRPVPFGDLSVLVPGCEHYAWSDSEITAGYGVFALIKIFDIFSRSFGDQGSA